VATTPDGEIVKTRELREEKGRATVSGVRSPYRQAQAPNMRPERLARLLRQADEGSTEAFFTLASEIEERDLHYRSVLTTRKLGVTSIPPTIQSASDKRRDVRIAEDVQNLVNEPAFRKLVFHMLDALGKGVSFVEIMWRSDASRWFPYAYKPRDQRWFAWDTETLETPLLITDASPQGEPLTPYKWVQHEPLLTTSLPFRGGLARPVVIAWCLKSFTLRDWMAFLEVYGMPFRIGKYPDGTKEEDKEALLDAVRALGADAAGIIHAETSIDIVSSATKGGAETFVMTAEYWDKQISKAVLGQTMTSDEGQGRGKAQAEVHNDVRLDLKRHDAVQVCATVREQLITPYVRLNYGDGVPIPGIKMETMTPGELEQRLSGIERFVSMGGRVEESYIRDTLSVPEPAEGAILLRPKGSAAPAEEAKPEPTGNDEPPATEPEDEAA
jgi:phage gp29-like protein